MTPIQLEALFHRAPRLIPSGPKEKDWRFKAELPKAIPPRYSVAQYLQLRDQLSIGSCVGFSIGFSCESIRNKFRPLDERSAVSTELIYTMGKHEAGLLGKGDTGTTIRGGLDAVRKWGVCAEVDNPYDLKDWDVMPSAGVLDLAAPHKLGSFERITLNPDDHRASIEALKQALVSGRRVVVGMFVPRGMFYINGPMSGHAAQWSWTDPAMGEHQGAHAILLGGWDDAIYPAGLGSALLANSWGSAWGDEGWTAIPWFALTRYAFEAWAVDGFDGYTDAAYVEPTLTAEQVAADCADLESLGVGSVVEGRIAFEPAPDLYQFAALRLLRKKGRTLAQMEQISGIPAAAIQGFIDANPAQVAAWDALL